MLSTFFVVLGAVTLLAAIVAFWQSARLLFAPPSDLSDAVLDSADRATLLDQKAAVLRSLKDLELDRSTGKVGEADYAKLEAQHRARAKEILRALASETSPFRAEAEKLVDDALGKAPEAAPKENAATAEPVAVKEPGCAKCGTANDADAAFCKKCGTKLGEEAAS